MSLVRARRRRTAARRPRARQGQGHQRRTLGDYHFEASPSTSVTRNSEATRIAALRAAERRREGSALLRTLACVAAHASSMERHENRPSVIVIL